MLPGCQLQQKGSKSGPSEISNPTSRGIIEEHVFGHVNVGPQGCQRPHGEGCRITALEHMLGHPLLEVLKGSILSDASVVCWQVEHGENV